jgi:hypothetical protein
MTSTTVVRYRTLPERADENEQLIRAVFADLAAQNPEGIRYLALRLDDGVSFVHVAVLTSDENPLGALRTFREFLAGIDDRCVDGPAPTSATIVGSYGLLGR